MVVIPATWEAQIGRIVVKVQARTGKQLRDSISKNNQSKMDWRCGSSGRAPALQVQSPEFKFTHTHTHTQTKPSFLEHFKVLPGPPL
jgi:hypothetical protein